MNRMVVQEGEKGGEREKESALIDVPSKGKEREREREQPITSGKKNEKTTSY